MLFIDEEGMSHLRGFHARWVAAAYGALGERENFIEWAKFAQEEGDNEAREGVSRRRGTTRGLRLQRHSPAGACAAERLERDSSRITGLW